MRKLMKTVRIALAAVLALVWASAVVAQAGALDGKVFVGTMAEKGKTKSDKDTFLFNEGKFRSVACDTYGFTETSYTAAVSGGATTFEAASTSPKEGTMKWKGTVKGDAIEGTAVWMKKGQADAHYIFKGTLKK